MYSTSRFLFFLCFFFFLLSHLWHFICAALCTWMHHKGWKISKPRELILIKPSFKSWPFYLNENEFKEKKLFGEGMCHFENQECSSVLFWDFGQRGSTARQRKWIQFKLYPTRSWLLWASISDTLMTAEYSSIKDNHRDLHHITAIEAPSYTRKTADKQFSSYLLCIQQLTANKFQQGFTLHELNCL